MKISLIQPSRNNKKYLEWSYNSIRKNQGNHDVEICVYDDASTDGTDLWCTEIAKKDKNFKWYRNDTGKRVGHTIGYDYLIENIATYDLIMIFHADMYLCDGALDSVEKYMYRTVHTDHVDGGFEFIPNKKTIVSLTRIEPPLHPPGKEKIICDCGIEPEEFNEEKLNEIVKSYREKNEEVTSGGVFAPWACFKEDFMEINGHDPLFAPQSKEDSDIFNRFKLNGVDFIQTWEGYVYHMTCRGSRFKDGAVRNPDGEVFMNGRETQEWLDQNKISTRNFIRKWGSMVNHDPLLHPIVLPKYDVSFVLENPTLALISILELYCSRLYLVPNGNFSFSGINDMKSTYVDLEQEYTKYDLSKRVLVLNSEDDQVDGDIILRINCKFVSDEYLQYITHINQIIESSGFIGKSYLGPFRIEMKSLKSIEKNLTYKVEK